MAEKECVQGYGERETFIYFSAYLIGLSRRASV